MAYDRLDNDRLNMYIYILVDIFKNHVAETERRKKCKFDKILVLCGQGLGRLAWDAFARKRTLTCKKELLENSRKVQGITQLSFFFGST